MDKKEKNIKRELIVILLVETAAIFYHMVVYNINSWLINFIMFLNIFMLIRLGMEGINKRVEKNVTNWGDDEHEE